MRALDEELADLADHYRSFARVEAAGVSPQYAELAAAAARATPAGAARSLLALIGY